MVRIEFHDHEVPIFRQLVDAGLKDLHTEIHHTDDRQYKAELKDRRVVLQRILDALSESSVVH
jgi:hypothetical protein